MGQRVVSPHYHSLTDLPIGWGDGRMPSSALLRRFQNDLNEPSGAAEVGYDDTLTDLGVDNVQDAIDALGGSSFLAPNEFYVDTTLTATRGRQCQTIDDALALADTLFAAGIEVIIRLREGQDHTWTGPAPITRDFSIYAEAQLHGQGTNPGAVGQLTLAAGGTLFPTPASTRRVEIRGLNVLSSGQVGMSHRWDLRFRDCTFAGLNINQDQGAAATSTSISFDGCSDAPDAVDDTLRVSVSNSGLLSSTEIKFNGCELTFKPTLGSVFQLGRASISFDGCTLRHESTLPAMYVVESISAGTSVSVVNTSIVVANTANLGLFIEAGTSTTVEAVTVSVQESGTGNYSLGGSLTQGTVNYAYADTTVGADPAVPAGTVVNDPTLFTADSGLQGPGAPSILDGQGFWLSAGSFIYAIVSTNGGVTVPIWWAQGPGDPTVSGDVLLPVPTNRNVRYQITLVARRTDVNGEYALFTFEGLINNAAGVVTHPNGPNKVTVVASVGGYDANVVVGAGGLALNVTGVAGRQINWRARMLWLVV